MSDATTKLRAYLRSNSEHQQTPPLSARKLLAYFGFEQRTEEKVEHVDAALRSLRLRTDPDFRAAHLDAPLVLKRLPPKRLGKEGEAAKGASEPTATDALPRRDLAPLSLRANMLVPPDQDLVTAKPQDDLASVVHRMLTRGVSQVPVVDRHHHLAGILALENVATRFPPDLATAKVSEQPLQSANSTSEEARLTPLLDQLLRDGWLVLHDDKRRVKSILTVWDLGKGFLGYVKPYLLVGEIESLIRRLFQSKLRQIDIEASLRPMARAGLESLKKALLAKLPDAEVDMAIDSIELPPPPNEPHKLTVAQYQTVLNKNWEAFGFGPAVSRKVFTEQIEWLRPYRNNIAHYSPDPLPESIVERLESLLSDLQRILDDLS